MDYHDVILNWVKEFIATMDYIDDLEIGNDSGDTPFGVKIIFDGFGYDEETDEENADKTHLSFAVFVHKDSLSKEFPEHELTPWALIHRPSEEVCFHVWYDMPEDYLMISTLEDSSTELDYDFVKNLILEIHKRDSNEEFQSFE